MSTDRHSSAQHWPNCPRSTSSGADRSSWPGAGDRRQSRGRVKDTYEVIAIDRTSSRSARPVSRDHGFGSHPGSGIQDLLPCSSLAQDRAVRRSVTDWAWSPVSLHAVPLSAAGRRRHGVSPSQARLSAGLLHVAQGWRWERCCRGLFPRVDPVPVVTAHGHGPLRSRAARRHRLGR